MEDLIYKTNGKGKWLEKGKTLLKCKILFKVKKLNKFTLAGVAQWTEWQLANQRVIGLISNQGTCLGCGSGPQEGALKRQPYIDVSLPLSLPSPLENRINKIFKKEKRKEKLYKFNSRPSINLTWTDCKSDVNIYIP